MSGNQFDRQIASKLREYTHPVSDNLWHTVEAGIRNDTRGTGFAWFGIALFMLIFTGLVTTTMPHVFESNQPETELSPNQSGITESTHVFQESPEAVQTDQLKVHLGQEGSGNDNSLSETNENIVYPSSDDVAGSSPSIRYSVNAQLNDKNIGASLGTEDRQKQYPNAANPKFLVQRDDETVKISGNVGSHSYHPARNDFTAFSVLKHNFLAALQSDEERLPTATLQKLRTDCYSFDGRQTGRFFVDIYTGGVYPIYQFESKAEFVPGYINARKSTERMRTSYALGMRGGYQLNAKMSILGGLHLTQVNRVFEFYNPSAQEYDTVYTEIKIISGQDTTITIDTSYSLVTGERYKTTYNKYTTLDVPILLGYKFISRNWHIAVQAGPVINILFRQKGDFLAPDGTPVNFSSSNDNAYPAYKSSLGVSLYTGLQVSRRVGFRTYLFAEPYLLYRLKDLTINSYPVSEHQEIIGLSFGLRVKI